MYAKYIGKLSKEGMIVDGFFPLANFEFKENKIYKIEELKDSRSLSQNRYMWALLRKIAIARGGERSAGDDEDIYIEALERANVEYEVFECQQGGFEMMQKAKGIGAIKLLNIVRTDYGDIYTFKVFTGSSKMNKSQMSMLLETVLDMAEESGVELIDYNY